MYLNFQAKGLLPDRTLESFILKSTEGAIPNLWETLAEFTYKGLFLINWEESLR